MDFKIEEQILGRGIFSNGTNQDDAQYTTNSSLKSNTCAIDSMFPSSTTRFSNKENPVEIMEYENSPATFNQNLFQGIIDEES